jgi:dihydroorotate dehydrogenase electron transfer subunit
MKKYYLQVKIIKNHQIAPGHFEMILQAPAIAKIGKPGQFIQIKVDNSLNPMLPRPLGLSKTNPPKGRIGIIYKVVGHGTRILSQRKKDSTVFVTGPLGNGFWLEKGVKNVALVAGGTGIGPILFLSQVWREFYPDLGLFAFIGARSYDLLCGQHGLQKFCQQLNCATDDGSFGHHGFITDILEQKSRTYKIDQVIAVGPGPMMKKAFEIASKLGIPSQVSLEEKMACGFGICMGCAARLSDQKHHLICCEGPVFAGEEVVWE